MGNWWEYRYKWDIFNFGVNNEKLKLNVKEMISCYLKETNLISFKILIMNVLEKKVLY